jgi:hypothetical protein
MWEDPKNWKHFYYYCPEDPRVIVPKRNGWFGWTINFAHRSAWIHLVLSIVGTPLVAMSFFALFSYIRGSLYPDWLTVTASLILTITLLCILGIYQSDTKRFDK